MDKVQKRYFRDIKRVLPGSARTKRQYIEELAPSVGRYIQQKDGISYDDLCVKFGSPQRIAEAYLTENPEKISRGAFVKRRVLMVAVVIVLIFVVGCVATAQYVSGVIDDFQQGYYVTEIESRETSELNPLPEPIEEY